MRQIHFTRRDFLKRSAILAGLTLATPFVPKAFGASENSDDTLAKFRAQFGAAPIQSQKLTDKLTLLSGPGGNAVVLAGDDGKIIIDTFVQPAWPNLKKALEAIGPQPMKLVIDTHWHFDHADNNGAFRADGVPVLAHVNTPRRMSEAHGIQELNIHFPP